MTLIGLYVPRRHIRLPKIIRFGSIHGLRAVSDISDLRHIFMRKSGRPTSDAITAFPPRGREDVDARHKVTHRDNKRRSLARPSACSPN